MHPLYRTDGGYAASRLQDNLRRATHEVDVRVVKRSDAGRFVVLPKRGLVGHTLG